MRCRCLGVVHPAAVLCSGDCTGGARTGGKEGKAFKQFERLCVRAYNILRKHAHMFINLFAMVSPGGRMWDRR